MDFKKIQKITDKEYDGNLTDYQNKIKLYKRLNKELKPIDDNTEYLVGQMKVYDRQK